MSVPPPNPQWIVPPADRVLLPASNLVDIEGVAQPLMEYAVHLAYLHWLLFASPLVVSQAKDAGLCSMPGHTVGKALDLSVADLSGEEFQLFYSIVGFSAAPRGFGVWWDVTRGEPTFVHVEVRE